MDRQRTRQPHALALTIVLALTAVLAHHAKTLPRLAVATDAFAGLASAGRYRLTQQLHVVTLIVVLALTVVLAHRAVMSPRLVLATGACARQVLLVPLRPMLRPRVYMYVRGHVATQTRMVYPTSSAVHLVASASHRQLTASRAQPAHARLQSAASCILWAEHHHHLA